jgi:hypothetical protein
MYKNVFSLGLSFVEMLSVTFKTVCSMTLDNFRKFERNNVVRYMRKILKCWKGLNWPSILHATEVC